MSGWCDAHLDLAYVALSDGRDLARPLADDHETGCVSLPALRAGRVDLVFATIFTEPGVDDPADPCGYPSSDDIESAHAAGRSQVEYYERLEQAHELTIVRSAADLDAEPTAPRPRAVLLMEGADPISDPAEVPAWFEAGVRMVGLTWAAGTRYAGGNSSHGPLTSLGADLVAALDAAGIAHDVSHLSDAAMDGVFETAAGPIAASHSNCRSITGDDQRHLRDDHIEEIGRRDGIVGLNLYTAFLAAGRRATVDDCVAHVTHVADLMGHRRGVGLGSDMDGGFGRSKLPVGLDHPTKLGALAEALRATGWSDEDLDGFRSGNWVRFMRGVLRGS